MVIPDHRAPSGPHAPATPPGPGADTLSDALSAAVERFRHRILEVGRRHGLSAADADEVIQDVRLRLWRSRGDPETLRSVGPSYVYSAAVSACVDVLRRRRARRTGVDSVADVAVTPLPVPETPDTSLERTELEAQIFHAVEQLLPTRRPVVRMHLAGYDREEIAATLGWTVGRVRNLLSRGLADLREILTRTGIRPESWS